MPLDASCVPLPKVDASIVAQIVLRTGMLPARPGFHTVRRSPESVNVLEEPPSWIKLSLHAEHEIAVARKSNEHPAEGLITCRCLLVEGGRPLGSAPHLEQSAVTIGTAPKGLHGRAREPLKVDSEIRCCNWA